MREPSLYIDPSYRAGLPELTDQEGYGESEDSGLVRDAVASMEVRHERAVRLRLVSKHQDEWEEFGVLNAGDGHASSEKRKPGRSQRARDQGGACTRRLRSSRGLQKHLVLKKTTLRMRAMLLLPAPPSPPGIRNARRAPDQAQDHLRKMRLTKLRLEAKKFVGARWWDWVVRNGLVSSKYCVGGRSMPWATVRAVRVNAATRRSKGDMVTCDMSGRVGVANFPQAVKISKRKVRHVIF
jgi:hypothetical protein